MARNGEIAVAREANFKTKPLLVVPVQTVLQLGINLGCNSREFVKKHRRNESKEYLSESLFRLVLRKKAKTN